MSCPQSDAEFQIRPKCNFCSTTFLGNGKGKPSYTHQGIKRSPIFFQMTIALFSERMSLSEYIGGNNHGAIVVGLQNLASK